MATKAKNIHTLSNPTHSLCNKILIISQTSFFRMHFWVRYFDFALAFFSNLAKVLKTEVGQPHQLPGARRF